MVMEVAMSDTAMSQATYPIIAAGIDCNPLAPAYRTLLSFLSLLSRSRRSRFLPSALSPMPEARNKTEPRGGFKRGVHSPPCRQVALLPSRPIPSTNKAATCVIVKAPKAKQVTSGGKLAICRCERINQGW